MSRRAAIVRYGCAVMSVLVALAVVRRAGTEAVGVAPLFFAAVMISAWYGGLGPGLLASALAGFVQHIAKPVDLARLEQAIEVAAQARCVPSVPPQSSPLRNGLSAVHGTDTVAGD